jgi:hypothetical protein
MPKPMRTVSFKLPADLDRMVSEVARQRRSTRSAVVRDALKALEQNPRPTVLDLAGDLIGAFEGPGDLSTNPKYMADFGK